MIAGWIVCLLLSQRAAGVDHLAAARAAEQAGNLPVAEREYQEYLAKRSDAAVLERLGLVRHLQNKFDDAIPALRRAIQLNGSLWGATLFLGIDLYKTNRFAEALPLLQKADEMKPSNPDALFWLGAAQLALKDTLTGLETLEQVARLQPRNAEVLRLLAEHYAALGSEVLSRVADGAPDTAAGLQIHGQALEFEGNVQAAADAYRQALSLDPKRPGLHAAIGRVGTALGKTEAAARAFEEELTIDPANPEANFARGSALVRENRLAEAVPYLEKAAQWSNDWPAPWIALAALYRSMGRYEEARTAAERAR